MVQGKEETVEIRISPTSSSHDDNASGQTIFQSKFIFVTLLFVFASSTAFAQVCRIERSEGILQRILHPSHVRFSRDGSIAAEGSLKESRLGFSDLVFFPREEVYFSGLRIQYETRSDEVGGFRYTFFSIDGFSAKGFVIPNRAVGGAAISLQYLNSDDVAFDLSLQYGAQVEVEDLLADAACILLGEM